jgi:hypothetical protein
VTVVDWVFRDRRTGRIVVAQRPNLPLVVWLVATVARAVLDPGGGWRTVIDVVGGVALGVWAVDEIARGVNPWRRGLGTVVLAGLVLSVVG